jgi:hypothetical protein
VIQYAAVLRFNDNFLGILDRPVKPGDDSYWYRAANLSPHPEERAFARLEG